MAEQILVTTRLRGASGLINQVSVQKFPILLKRITEKLHLRHEHIFTEEEHEQLCGLFSISDGDLRTVLESCAYLFEQAAYHTIHPNSLKELLVSSDMDEEHAQAMATVWGEEATELVNRLKDQTMSGPLSLVDSQYRLHLMMGESNLTRLKDPSALFEFSLAQPAVDQAPAAATAGGDNVVVEFSHAELYDLFLKLEKVQEQLDGLS